jgi:hypothetical protein
MSHESILKLLIEVGFSRIRTFLPFDESRRVGKTEPSFIVRAQR